MTSSRLALPISNAPRGAATFGANIASDAMLDAIIRYSSMDGFVTITTDAGDASSLERARALAAERASRLRSLPARALLQAGSTVPVDVWHDVRPRTAHRRAAAWRSATGRAIPLTFTHHTFSSAAYLHEMFLPLLLYDFRVYDALVCTSHAAKSAIQNILESLSDGLAHRLGARPRCALQLPVIPLGVDTNRFRPRNARACRQELGVPAEQFVVLWVGRLSPLDKADLFPLLRAFARVVAASQDPAMHLYIVSSLTGPYGEALQRAAATLGIAGHVTIDGRGSPELIPTWLGAADVFVSPVDNVQETFGLTPVEAMAAGIPQVVSDWSGYRDTVQHGTTGFLIPTRRAATDHTVNLAAALLGDSVVPEAALAASTEIDLDALVAALTHLWREPGLRRAMAAASRVRACTHFAWPHVIAQHDALWQGLVEHASHAVQGSAAASDPWLPRYDAHYAHFGSDTLDIAAPVWVTQEGHEWLADQQPVAADSRWDPFLSSTLARTVLTACAAANAEGDAMCVADLEDLRGAYGADTDWLPRHIMWLLKQGFARTVVTEPKQSADPRRRTSERAFAAPVP